MLLTFNLKILLKKYKFINDEECLNTSDMAKLLASIKAIMTRLIFASHGFVTIWQVTTFKKSPIYWYLCCPIILLFFEGIFTLTIKENQEWKW